MVPNALFLSLALMLALGHYLMGELKSLIPYRPFLLHEYGWAFGIFVADCFSTPSQARSFSSKFFLKDTGWKLSNIDKQFHIGDVRLSADSDVPFILVLLLRDLRI